LAAEVERLRLDFPMWGKNKIGPIVRELGFAVSDATVGRILSELIKRGRAPAVPALLRKIGPRSAPKKRPYAVRKPKDVAFEKPGDVVQIDTLSISILPGQTIKQFTAYDPFAKWTVAKPYKARHGKERGRVPGPRARANAQSRQSGPNRWRKRVHGRVRAGLRRRQNPSLRSPAPIAQTQRRRGTLQRSLAV
jgi:hypothetical protein